MWKYILRRTVQVIITLFIYLFITYFLLDAQPGDMTLQYMNPHFTETQRLALVTRLGLDRPVTERFIRWVGNMLHGELGDSFVETKPVLDIIIERAPRTIFLFLTAALTTFGVGYYDKLRVLLELPQEHIEPLIICLIQGCVNFVEKAEWRRLCLENRKQ